jgi:hypothetical protein
VKKFKGYIEFTHFTVETDHQALCWLQRIKEPVGRLARWAYELQGYDFTIAYRSGALNRTADALSRAYEVLSCEVNDLPNKASLIEAQQQDSALKSIIDYIQFGTLPNVSTEEKTIIVKKSRDAFVDTDGCLFKHVGPKTRPWEDESYQWRVWIPESLRDLCISFFHSHILSGHLGTSKTYKKLEERVWWFSMRKDVCRYIRRCNECQLAKPNRAKPAGFASSPPILGPWDMLALDLMGPYAKGVNQSSYLLVIVDYFTKWVELFPLRKATADNIIKKLWEVACRWGFPKIIVSDNGKQFRSHIFKNWCIQFGIQSTYIAPYHPQANITERYNETLKSMIITTIDECKYWDRNLHELAFALRTSCNESSGFSPAYLNTGRIFRTPFENKLDIQVSSGIETKDMARRMAYIHELAKAALLNSQLTYQTNYNKKHRDIQYKLGDIILKKSHILSDSSKRLTSSLCNKYEGPYEICGKKSNAIYTLKKPNSNIKCGDVHISNIKLFISENGVRKKEIETCRSSLPASPQLGSSDDSCSQSPNLHTHTQAQGQACLREGALPSTHGADTGVDPRPTGTPRQDRDPAREHSVHQLSFQAPTNSPVQSTSTEGFDTGAGQQDLSRLRSGSERDDDGASLSSNDHTRSSLVHSDKGESNRPTASIPDTSSSSQSSHSTNSITPTPINPTEDNVG